MSNEWTKGTDMCVSIRCVMWADGMKAPFASATEELTVTATEFVMDKVSAGRITTMSGMDIAQYAWKERLGTQATSRGYLPAADRMEIFCTLINFLLTLTMFPDDMQSYAAREWITPLQARLAEEVRSIWDDYNKKYMMVMKEWFDERIIAYFNEDIRRWAARLRDSGYKLRRSTMSYPRPHEAGPVPVPAFKHTARWKKGVGVRNAGRGWGGDSRSSGRVRNNGEFALCELPRHTKLLQNSEIWSLYISAP